jgi:membrane protease YdiL (CAAX protease family)
MWLSGQSAMRRLAILEPLLMFGLIVTHIWKVRLLHPYWWIGIPALMFFSHRLHRESLRALGFGPPNRWDCLKQLAIGFILVALLLLPAGFLLGSLRQINFAGTLLALAGYLPWGMAQQYAINGYFLRRFDAALSARASSLATALLFSAAHAPNPFLMAVTLPLGWGSTLLYRRTRNLYLLGMAHAAIGLLLFLVVPDSVSRHMRVGPGWFRR